MRHTVLCVCESSPRCVLCVFDRVSLQYSAPDLSHLLFGVILKIVGIGRFLMTYFVSTEGTRLEESTKESERVESGLFQVCRFIVAPNWAFPIEPCSRDRDPVLFF